jgi:ABC-type phosphate transport system substrate-binding protein
MQRSKIKIGLATAGAVATTFVIAVPPASADYAPVAKDVVGVGSDTVQYASDFVADGDYVSDTGYNALGNKFKLVNFDATPDANARLAYGVNGGQAAQSTCTPGTGSTKGTGNQTTTNTGIPCVLNPTIVIRAGASPILRPNGSGAGAAAGSQDTKHYISYVRASAPKGSTLDAGSQGKWDSITVGTDDLKMLAATTTNAVPLSTAQLNAIYSCTTTNWSAVGGATAGTIIPIIPQVGSGTRSTFLADIGNPTLGGCVQTGEENDPYAIGNSSSPVNAIEPMSSGRLNMFKGIGGSYFDGSTNNPSGSINSTGYFKDPSCTLDAINTSTPSACAAANNSLTPPVKFVTGTPSSGTLYDDTRNLYIYFRQSDLASTTPWQSGAAAGFNWVRALFYDPCPDNPPVAGDGCSNDPIAGEVGPFGAPYYATGAGQQLIASAGINATYAVTIDGP